MAQRIKGENKVQIEGELKAGDGVKFGDTTYEYGADLTTSGVPVIDPGTGKTIAIRTFEFSINPELKQMPEKQELFNAHYKQISTILWGDGLVPFDEVPPRVIIDSKKHKYYIFVPCQARLSTVFVDKANNLSELLKAPRQPQKLETPGN